MPWLHRRSSDAGSPPLPGQSSRRGTLGLIALVALVALAGGTAAALLGHHNPTPTVAVTAASPSPSSVVPSAPIVTAWPVALVGSLPSPSPFPTFEPAAVTAVNDTQFWVLGTEGACTECQPAIEHTDDGGATFTAVGPPATAYGANSPSGAAGSIDDLRFADPSDGWAFGPGLWSTHDGGAHWQSLNLGGTIDDLEPGAGGYVYAVVATCPGSTEGRCPVDVMRSSEGNDDWTSMLVVSGTDSPPPALGVQGYGVWLLEGSGLWRSLNTGVTFTQLTSPCFAELGGNLDPVSASVLWAFCPTGMSGGSWLSTDGGISFVNGGGLASNAGMVAALSAQTAFLDDRETGRLSETDDGGTTFAPVAAPAGDQIRWIGFTDASIGYALLEVSDENQPQLWRTVDAGTDWGLVTVP